MPRYLDVHRNLKGTRLQDVVGSDAKDLQVQSKRGVNFLKFWLDEE